jgi:hypothetical protein
MLSDYIAGGVPFSFIYQYRFRALLKEYFHFFSKLFAIVLFASDGSFRSLRFALFNPRAIRSRFWDHHRAYFRSISSPRTTSSTAFVIIFVMCVTARLVSALPKLEVLSPLSFITISNFFQSALCHRNLALRECCIGWVVIP